MFLSCLFHHLRVKGHLSVFKEREEAKVRTHFQAWELEQVYLWLGGECREVLNQFIVASFDSFVDIVTPRGGTGVHYAHHDDYDVWLRLQSLMVVASHVVGVCLEALWKPVFYRHFGQVFGKHDLSGSFSKVNKLVLILPFGILNHVIKLPLKTFVPFFDSVHEIAFLCRLVSHL